MSARLELKALTPHFAAAGQLFSHSAAQPGDAAFALATAAALCGERFANEPGQLKRARTKHGQLVTHRLSLSELETFYGPLSMLCVACSR